MEYQRSLCTQFEMPRASRIARVKHFFVCVFVSLLHESSHVNREKRIKTKEQTTIAQLCLLQRQQQTWDAPAAPTAWDLCPTSPKARVCLSRRQHSPKLDSSDSSGVWATLQVAAAGRLQVEQQPDAPAAVGSRATARGLLTHAFLRSRAPASTQHRCISLRAGPASCRRSNAGASFQETRHQIKSGTSGHCFIAELWHHPSQSKLKIKPFMSAYLSAWEMRLTQCTVDSAMRSGPRSPPLPVPRQRSTITFPQRRMACGPASASAGMPSLSDHRTFRAAPHEASTRFQGMEARKDNNA